jgi:DNA mismatch repair ATPase MutL
LKIAQITGVTVLINHRPVNNRTLSYAVSEAYGSLVPTGRQPVAVVSVRVPPDEVDFNVHPSKLEVKLLRERAVYAAIQRGLRAALASAEWSVATLSGEAELDDHGLGESLRELRVLGQAGKTYLIAEGELGVYLVDQHAAHEQVLLEELRRSLALGPNNNCCLNRWCWTFRTPLSRWSNSRRQSCLRLASRWSRSVRAGCWCAGCPRCSSSAIRGASFRRHS